MNKRSLTALVPNWLRRLTPQLYLLLHPKVQITFFIVVGGSLAATDIGNSDGITRSTPIAHRDTITLTDHTTLDLNANTSILIKQNTHERQVLLEKGEIRASGHHDSTNPLEIVVGQVTLQVMGTQFDVAFHQGVSAVSVTEGKVRLYERRDDGSLVNPISVTESGARRDPVVLEMGDAARLEEHGGTVLVSRDRNDLLAAQSRTAWLQGQFIADKRRLDEIFWQFEAYNKIRILTDDPTIAKTEIGGSYHLAHVEEFFSVLHSALDLDVTLVQGDHNGLPTYFVRRHSSVPAHLESPRHRGGARTRESPPLRSPLPSPPTQKSS